jgi:hypothetical protein
MVKIDGMQLTDRRANPNSMKAASSALRTESARKEAHIEHRRRCIRKSPRGQSQRGRSHRALRTQPPIPPTPPSLPLHMLVSKEQLTGSQDIGPVPIPNIAQS